MSVCQLVIWFFWLNFWTSRSKKGGGLFLIEWYLSGKFGGFYSNLESKPPGSLKWSKTGFLIVSCLLDLYSVLMHFMKLPFLSEKNGTKKPGGAVCNFPRAEVCGGSSSPCALGRLASWGSSHQGGLSSCHQGQAWRSPETGKRCHCTQFARPAEKGRNFSCHSLLLHSYAKEM